MCYTTRATYRDDHGLYDGNGASYVYACRLADGKRASFLCIRCCWLMSNNNISIENCVDHDEQKKQVQASEFAIEQHLNFGIEFEEKSRII